MTLAEQIYAQLAAADIEEAVVGEKPQDLALHLRVAAAHAVTAAVIFEEEIFRRREIERQSEKPGEIRASDRMPEDVSLLESLAHDVDRIADTLQLIRDEMPDAGSR